MLAALVAVQAGGVGCRCVQLGEAEHAEHSEHAADACCPGQEAPCDGLDLCGCCQAVAAVVPEAVLADVPERGPTTPSLPADPAPAESVAELLRPPIS